MSYENCGREVDPQTLLKLIKQAVKNGRMSDSQFRMFVEQLLLLSV